MGQGLERLAERLVNDARGRALERVAQWGVALASVTAAAKTAECEIALPRELVADVRAVAGSAQTADYLTALGIETRAARAPDALLRLAEDTLKEAVAKRTRALADAGVAVEKAHSPARQAIAAAQRQRDSEVAAAEEAMAAAMEWRFPWRGIAALAVLILGVASIAGGHAHSWEDFGTALVIAGFGGGGLLLLPLILVDRWLIGRGLRHRCRARVQAAEATFGERTAAATRTMDECLPKLRTVRDEARRAKVSAEIALARLQAL